MEQSSFADVWWKALPADLNAGRGLLSVFFQRMRVFLVPRRETSHGHSEAV
jgi:hypothetical protein